MPQQDLLRSIPSVDKLLEEPAVLNLIRQGSRPFVVRLLRKVLLSFRQSVNGGIVKDSQPVSLVENILAALQNEFERATKPQLTKVINATGVLAPETTIPPFTLCRKDKRTLRNSLRTKGRLPCRIRFKTAGSSRSLCPRTGCCEEDLAGAVDIVLVFHVDAFRVGKDNIATISAR